MKSYKDTENRIIGNLLRNPVESKSLRKVSIDTGLSYVTVHKLVPRLLKRELIKQKKKGKAHLVSINFEQARIEDLTSANIAQRIVLFKRYPYIALLLGEIEDSLAGQFFILLLFGSYAKDTATTQSDIDLLFIVPETADKESYNDKIKKAIKLHPKIRKDFALVTTADFMQMLNQKYSVGRAAFQTGLALFGAEQYYTMVKKYVGEKGY